MAFQIFSWLTLRFPPPPPQTCRNDFAFYDHVLDMSFLLGNVPPKYAKAARENNLSAIDTMFAMGRGRQRDGVDVEACESAYTTLTSFCRLC